MKGGGKETSRGKIKYSQSKVMKAKEGEHAIGGAS